MRLISICPSNTELLAFLEIEHLLVGIDDFSDWPQSICDLPRLGPDLSINMEKLEKLKPDLVLASLSVPGMEKNVVELERRNIPHIVLNPGSLSDIADDLLLVGEKTGYEHKAREVVNRYNNIIDDYKKRSSAIKDLPTLYWEWWPKPIFSPGGFNWLTEISMLAGGKNIFSNKDTASYQAEWDEIRKINPDHICLAWVGVQQEKMKPELIRKRPNALEMKAIQNNNIHILEESLYCRPSPRLLVGLKKLASILHPTIFSNNDGIDTLLEKNKSAV
ncbi:cobalamin-binding protein [Bacillus salitolerans]|uniref:Cobalamin-binding protein n=1 Tax=Bacillus salitolerans TaxID=1437434 RepID=A0ABW4LRJ4_9BACI